MKSVKVLPVMPFTEGEFQKKKVAAYCRISTEFEEQHRSLAAQMGYYKEKIQSNPDWLPAGVFFDCESGLRIEKRSGLKKMMELVRLGQIDYILTKSISRVSRDALDTLLIIRELKERGVDMYFEKENIHSIDSAKEIDIALGAALAQEESHNLSENISWGYKRKCETGAKSLLLKPVYGFCCKNDELVIVPEEADVVKEIFKLYLNGKTVRQIKTHLENSHILSPSQKTVWADSTIRKILKCEKYKGDVMLHKTYTDSYLTGKRAVNYGQRARYYVASNHIAIISPEIFQQVQDEIFRRAQVVIDEQGEQINTGNRYSGKYLLGNLLKCGNCGASYYHRTERGKIVWRCGTRMEKGRNACQHSVTLCNERIQVILAEAVCDGVYKETVIKEKVQRIDVYESQIIICFLAKGKYRICELN